MLTAWKHDLTVWNISIISISATRNKIQYGLTLVQNEESENRSYREHLSGIHVG